MCERPPTETDYILLTLSPARVEREKWQTLFITGLGSWFTGNPLCVMAGLFCIVKTDYEMQNIEERRAAGLPLNKPPHVLKESEYWNYVPVQMRRGLTTPQTFGMSKRDE